MSKIHLYDESTPKPKYQHLSWLHHTKSLCGLELHDGNDFIVTDKDTLTDQEDTSAFCNRCLKRVMGKKK